MMEQTWPKFRAELVIPFSLLPHDHFLEGEYS